VRQREDDMEVGHGEQLGRTLGQPLGACVSLALGTVPVAARVIGDSLMAAAQTLIAMASESRSAATGGTGLGGHGLGGTGAWGGLGGTGGSGTLQNATRRTLVFRLYPTGYNSAWQKC
jgi:hypothetical protein